RNVVCGACWRVDCLCTALLLRRAWLGAHPTLAVTTLATAHQQRVAQLPHTVEPYLCRCTRPCRMGRSLYPLRPERAMGAACQPLSSSSNGPWHRRPLPGSCHWSEHLASSHHRVSALAPAAHPYACSLCAGHTPRHHHRHRYPYLVGAGTVSGKRWSDRPPDCAPLASARATFTRLSCRCTLTCTDASAVKGLRA